jgi:hypothetical protein
MRKNLLLPKEKQVSVRKKHLMKIKVVILEVLVMRVTR